MLTKQDLERIVRFRKLIADTLALLVPQEADALEVVKTKPLDPERVDKALVFIATIKTQVPIIGEIHNTSTKIWDERNKPECKELLRDTIKKLLEHLHSHIDTLKTMEEKLSDNEIEDELIDNLVKICGYVSLFT